jgi:hypothetical protein
MEIFGFYGYFGWGILTKPIKITESFGDLIRVTIGHLTGFLFLYGIPVVVVIISILQSLKTKDYKSFVFLLWGSIIFLAFLAMTLKFSYDYREAEPWMRLYARYYFFVFPFFLIAFLIFLKRIGQSKLNAAAFILMSSLVGVTITTVFPVFFPNMSIHTDFIEWAWLNTFFPTYRSYVDLYGWNWWGAENIKLASAVLVVLTFFLGLYYALSKCRPLYPYLFFLALFSILGNIFALRIHAVYSVNAWQMTNYYLNQIESTITNFNDSVMLIGSWYGMDMSLAFWLPYEKINGVRLLPESYVTDDIIPPGTKWVVLMDRYNVTAQLQLIRSDGVMNIYRLPEVAEP